MNHTVEEFKSLHFLAKDQSYCLVQLNTKMHLVLELRFLYKV